MSNQIDYIPEKIRAIVIGVGQVGKGLLPSIRATPQNRVYHDNPLNKLEAYPYVPGIEDKLPDQAMVFLIGSISHPDFKSARELIFNHKPFFLWSIGIASQGIEGRPPLQIRKREGLLLTGAKDSLTLLETIYQGHSGGIIGYDLSDTVKVCGGHRLSYGLLEANFSNYEPAIKKLLKDNNQSLLQARGVILMVQFNSQAFSLADLDSISNHLLSSVGKKTDCHWTAVEVPGLLPDLRALILIV